MANFYSLEKGRTRALHVALLASCATVGLLSISAAYANPSDDAINRSVGVNTEMVDPTIQIASGTGFSITVDGEHVAGEEPLVIEAPKAPSRASALPVPQRADRQRQADIGLERVAIGITFDGLEVEPILNVSTTDLRRAHAAGEAIRFQTSSNYPAWIERSEIRISSDAGTEILPVVINGTTEWTMPGGGADEYTYVLRVYDKRGRFDETKPLSLIETEHHLDGHEVDGVIVVAGRGDNRSATRNIPIHGGAVTIRGSHVPSGYEVRALGETIPVDGANKFVAQRILPPGDHDINVGVGSDTKADGVSFVREINIPDNDWFYVGLADLTLGKRFASDAIEAADPDRYDDVYSKGRLAFYLKGKIRGKYILTAAADTTEDDLDKLLSGLDEKDPRSFLKRIDPDEYYPVYGDDSTLVEDAPTRGKFYVRLENGDSHVMWGNFKTAVTGTKFLRNERALYGASAVIRSENTTEFGERKYEAVAYAASPETLPQREVLRGTGGSVYFLKRQDITPGSSTVAVLISDRTTGRIVERVTLNEGADYEFDHAQGVIVLRQPLSAYAGRGGVVRGRAIGDGDASLAVSYEYTPAAGDVDGYSYGGRAQAWLGEHIRVGVTGMNEETGVADQEMYGADIVLRHSEGTYLSAEIAETRGPGFGSATSIDGGLSIENVQTAGTRGRTGRAIRVEGQVDISDFDNRWAGKLGGYIEDKTAGFSSLDYDIDVDERIWGLYAEVDLTDNVSVSLSHDDFEDAAGKTDRESEASVKTTFAERWTAEVGIARVERESATADDDETGERIDIGAQIGYAFSEDLEVYAFGQTTVSRSGDIRRNDRYGVGAEVQLTEKIALEAEVSDGTTGVGALAAITYDPTADDQYYLGYKLDPDRSFNASDFDSDDLGGIVVGAKRKYSDQLSAYTENTYDMFGRKRSLSASYGVTYTPNNVWTFSGGYEAGHVNDWDSPDFERHVGSLSIGYNDEDRVSARLRAEIRVDDSDDNAKDRETLAFLGGVSVKVSDDWRVLGKVDALISNSDEADVLDGDYVEASLGFAYRPVDNERLQALVRYAYLYDLPGVDQVNNEGSDNGPAQRSHIFSADFNYDLTKWLTVGAKYGMRIGEVSHTRLADDFSKSSAHLGIVRADIHVVNNWDVLLEGRVLHLPELDQTKYGGLFAVYRHFGQNVKAGVGYNFGSFSDNVADLTYDDQGVFFNLVGKW